MKIDTEKIRYLICNVYSSKYTQLLNDIEAVHDVTVPSNLLSITLSKLGTRALIKVIGITEKENSNILTCGAIISINTIQDLPAIRSMLQTPEWLLDA